MCGFLSKGYFRYGRSITNMHHDIVNLDDDINKIIGTLPCCVLGARLPPLLLILAPAGSSNPTGI